MDQINSLLLFQNWNRVSLYPRGELRQGQVLNMPEEWRPTRGARSARANARLCTSSGINLIVPLSFHLVR